MKAYKVRNSDIAKGYFHALLFTLFCVTGIIILASDVRQYKGNVGFVIVCIVSIIAVIGCASDTIKYFVRSRKSNHDFIRIDEDGIILNDDNIDCTVSWPQIDMIELCLYKDKKESDAPLCLYLYRRDDKIVIFDLTSYRNGMNSYRMIKAIKFFSKRPNIIKYSPKIFLI